MAFYECSCEQSYLVDVYHNDTASSKQLILHILYSCPSLEVNRGVEFDDDYPSLLIELTKCESFFIITKNSLPHETRTNE